MSKGLRVSIGHIISLQVFFVRIQTSLSFCSLPMVLPSSKYSMQGIDPLTTRPSGSSIQGNNSEG